MNYFSQHNFFIKCEPYPQDIAVGLIELFARESDWRAMGNNARKMIEQLFNWPKITEVMLDNYQRIAFGKIS